MMIATPAARHDSRPSVRAILSATGCGVPMNGRESRLTLRVAISRRVGVRPGM
jgi:hypothetical protein